MGRLPARVPSEATSDMARMIANLIYHKDTENTKDALRPSKNLDRSFASKGFDVQQAARTTVAVGHEREFRRLGSIVVSYDGAGD